MDSKWIIEITVSIETLKFLKENREKLCDLELGKDIYAITPKASSTNKNCQSWMASKFKTYVFQKTPLENEISYRLGVSYLHIMYLIIDISRIIKEHL